MTARAFWALVGTLTLSAAQPQHAIVDFGLSVQYN